MPSPRSRWFGVSTAMAIVLAPALALAANGNMPRTPALYPEHACLTMVDRSVDPVVQFAVHIPFEDTMITEDELPDSRTFSFFGLCRDPGRLEVLPNWIAADDAVRAKDAGIIDALPAADDVLLDDPSWAVGHDGADTCVQRMLDQPMPISCAGTADGVAWDTTNVPAGNYVVRGYTFAPPSNLWTTRNGVIQVHDGAPLPVATLVSPTFDASAYQEDGYRVIGCMAGPPGTTVSLQWASTSSDDLGDDAAWTAFVELDAADAIIDEHLDLPEQTVYLGLLLRAVATAPDGARWIGQAPGFVTVYPGDGVSDPPQVPAPQDHCGAGGDTSGGFDADSTGGAPDDGTGSGGTTGTSTGVALRDESSGCGCTAAAPFGPWWWLVFVPWRRRRAAVRDDGARAC